MSNSQQTKEEIRAFIAKKLMFGVEPSEVPEDFTSSSQLDSLSRTELVIHVETRYGITVDPYEEETDFDTLDGVVSLITRKAA